MINFDGSDIMHNKYSYDAVDNILGIANTVNPQELSNNSAKLGGESSHTYQYDALNRLISASGKAKDASYTLDMAYNVMSMPVSKAQSVENSSKAASYTNVYKYEDAEHPTAPSQIGHEHYTYDANGNPVRVENDSTDATRELYWDEDNRLMVLSDNGKTSRYTYNHAGERIVKSHGSMEGVYINGAPQGITFHETDEYTLYPASILSVTKNRFTKHYFIGSKRVASRIGSGSFNNMYGVNGSHVTAGQQDYAERLNQIESQKEDYYKKLGIAPGIPTMKGSYADPENTGIGYNTIIKELGDHSVPAEWAQYVKKNTEADTAPGAPIAWDEPSDPDEAQPGYGYVADGSADSEETYYFHSDHLGSTSYITDKDGNITQYDAYLPYGELLVDEHSSSEEMPYKFNGKELDEETGLYYYGARYMQPVASIWYGVDPLTEKYPNMGAYVYCAGNPIRFSDPNGQDWWDKVKGFGAALVDNATGGLTDIRTYAGRNVSDPKDFNAGLTAGDIASLTVGTIESGTGSAMVASGTSITTVGLVAEGPSLGTSTAVVVVGGADAAVGAGLTAHGAVMMANASKNLSEKKGHLDTGNSKASTNRGTIVYSKTLWKDSKGNRIDVENPNPGQRPGQIHFQDNKKNKYLYNNKDGRFYSRDPKTKNGTYLRQIE